MEELESCKLVSRISQKSLYLASFSNCGIKVKCNERIKFQVYKSSEEESNETILVSNSGRVEYVGYNYGIDAKNRNQYCKFYIGKLNKKTGKMKIYSAQLFFCKPYFLTPDENLGISEEKTYMEKVDALTGAFGSKYRIKAMQLRHEFSLETESLESSAAGAPKAALEEDIPETMKVLTVKNEFTENIPLQNRNATHPEDVYALNNIITKEEYTSIENEAKILAEANIQDINMWRSNKQYGSYIIHHCDQFQDMEKAKLLAYYNLLVLMIKLKAKDLNSKDPAPSIPEPFKHSLLGRFTVTSINKSGKMSKSKIENKVLAYILVLALFIDDFKINLDDIQSDFTGKISLKRLTEIAHALGCHVNSNTNIAVLKIPLFIPTGAGYSSGTKQKV